MKAIIPCAGYGTRMGMKPHQSKEMLIDPMTGKPLIDYALNICLQKNMTPVVVTRQVKKDLIEHCQKRQVQIVLTMPNGSEWPDSVLMSNYLWDRYNVLIFPDTRFESVHVLNNVQSDLKLGANFSVALHKVKDPEKWCVVENYNIIEKPSDSSAEFAMGFVGFTRDSGQALFKALEQKDKYFPLVNTSFRYLSKFVDITRGTHEI